MVLGFLEECVGLLACLWCLWISIASLINKLGSFELPPVACVS